MRKGYSPARCLRALKNVLSLYDLKRAKAFFRFYKRVFTALRKNNQKKEKFS